MTVRAPVAVRRPHRRRILAVLIVSQLAIWLDTTVLNVALKTLGDPVRGLGASPSELEWSISSYTLICATLLFTGGVLADRYGRRRVLSIGLLLFGAASVWAAYSSTAVELILARGAMGAGSALVIPATLAIIHNVFDEESRTTAIAVWSGFTGLAVGLGPVVGGLLLDHFWWGSVFLLNAPVAVVGVIGARLVLPETRETVRRPFDPAGVALSTVGLLALVYGIIRGGQLNRWTDAQVVGPIAAGLLLLAAFALIERRIAAASFDVRLFRHRRFTGASCAVMLTFFGLIGSMFFAIFYLQGVRELSPFHSGLVLTPVAVGVLLGAPLSDPLCRRFGIRAVAVTALVVVSGTFLGYAAMTAHTPLWRFDVLLLVQGLGMGAVMAPTTELIMSTLPRDRSGAGAAIGNALRQVGGVLGVAVLGTILFSSYRSRVGASLADLPLAPHVREAAATSPEATQQLARSLHLPRLFQAADDAYLGAMHVTAACSALAALCGALLLLGFLRPARAAAQLAGPRPVEEGL